MIAGSMTAILWTWAGKPWGIHGFIIGSAVSFAVIAFASLYSNIFAKSCG